MRFLQDIPQETIRTGIETIELFRLGTTNLGTFELACLYPGTYEPHVHDQTSSLIHVVSGTGIVHVQGKRRSYGPGDDILIPQGAPHGFVVATDTVLFARLDRAIKDTELGEFDFRYANE